MSLFIETKHRRRAGVALILALGVTMIMAWISLAILERIREELALKAAPATEDKLRQTAYQLVEVSMGVLAEVKRFEGGLYSPSQGWGYPLLYAGMTDSETLTTALQARTGVEADGQANAEPGDAPAPEPPDGAASLLADLLAEDDPPPPEGFARPVTQVRPDEEMLPRGQDSVELELPNGIEARVRIYDESGKLSLTATNEARWLLFFEEMGFEESEAKSLTDSLLDWMDADKEERENGAETLTYSQLEPPYRAADRPLRDFDELRFLQAFKESFFDENGLPNANFALFKQNVSLFHSDEVNLNTASEIVIRTLAEEKEFEADNVLDFLKGADLTFGTEDDRVLYEGLPEDRLPVDEKGDPIQIFRPVRFVTVEIALSAGQSIFRLNVTLDLSQPHPGGVYPFRIVRIVENQPIS
jgi:hypothetical protein